MSDKVIDLNKVRFMKSVGRDMLLYEWLATHGQPLDRELHRVGGIQGLFVPSKARGSLEQRAAVFTKLLEFGATEQELFNALSDSVIRGGSTLETARLHFNTSTAIYRCDEVRQRLREWGLDVP